MSDGVFAAICGVAASIFIVTVLAMLLSMLGFTRWTDVTSVWTQRPLRFALVLTVATCTVSAILSTWIAIPTAYLLTRYRFPGRTAISLLIDVPLMLPPLVVGLGLLILFQFPIAAGRTIESWFRDGAGFPITYHWPAIIIAQSIVACALATRTIATVMETAGDRRESFVRTLGCTRAAAFFAVTLPESRRGIAAAFALAWARSIGEFGPVLVFAGSTRMKTEVLSTSIYLELNAGRVESAVAIALWLVGLSMAALVTLRWIEAK